MRPALEETELYVLQREQFEKLREEHKRLACHLVEAVAKVLALRLRYSDKGVDGHAGIGWPTRGSEAVQGTLLRRLRGWRGGHGCHLQSGAGLALSCFLGSFRVRFAVNGRFLGYDQARVRRGSEMATTCGRTRMFQHILLPTDGSQLSRDTAERAVSFAKGG
jgi:CRP-like cAMP-binding protein